MNFKDFLDLSDKKTRKVLMMSVYTFLAILVLFFFFRKRSPPTRTASALKASKKEDTRPRICVCGSLISTGSLFTLSKISKFSKLHLVFKVQNNEEEAEIKKMLNEVTTIAPHRILFCETEIGYKALIRQLAPQLHIEESLRLAEEMSGYVNAIALVSDEESNRFYQIFEFRNCEAMIVNILNDLH